MDDVQHSARLRKPWFSYRWELLALLWLAFFFNQADRQVFSVVLTSIRAELGLSDADLGLIAAVLFWTLGLLFPVAGYVGDRWSKKWTITAALTFWSLATLCTGFSRNALHLIAFRSLATGGGEAFYAPAAFALIAQFHRRTRALAMSIHQTAIYAGFVLSGALGGYLSQHYGWRSAFYVFGSAGVVLAIVLLFRLKDSDGPSDERQPEQQSKPRAVRPLEAVFAFARTPTALLLTAAYTGMIFMHLAYLTWSPTFFREKFGLTEAAAGFSSMFYFQAFALVGVLVGGVMSDRWAQRRRTARMEMLCFGMASSMPWICLMGLATTPTMAAVGLAGFGLFRGFYDANSYAALFDVIRPRYRASANALMSTAGFLIGGASPYAMGVLKAELGLSWAFALFSLAHLAAAGAILVARIRFFHRDFCETEELGV
jgi:MFS transporter, Spinster family, sphingosine-1-phosphate transporter